MKHLGYLSSLPQFGILPTYGQDWASSLMLDVLLGAPSPATPIPPSGGVCPTWGLVTFLVVLLMLVVLLDVLLGGPLPCHPYPPLWRGRSYLGAGDFSGGAADVGGVACEMIFTFNNGPRDKSMLNCLVVEIASGQR